MSNRDARSIMFNNVMENLKEEHEKELASVERKWEFRYENQDKRLRELEATIKRQTAKIRELKAKCNKLGEAT